MADVRTGKLRERIDIYEEVTTVNEFGSSVTNNVLYWQTYANVYPLSSSKSLLANQEQLKNGYHITVRYRKDKSVAKPLLVNYRGKWLNLTSLIADDVMKDYVEFIGTYKDTKGGSVEG